MPMSVYPLATPAEEAVEGFCLQFKSTAFPYDLKDLPSLRDY